jgi:hypothetical protein
MSTNGDEDPHMTNEGESIAKTENELMELLQSGNRRIVYTGPIGSISKAIDFATRNGYKWYREHVNDSAHPGMSLLETCLFTKVSH